MITPDNRAVELFGVCKRFGDVRALDNVDFAATKGRIHGLLGENGAGKSTLMNILYGLYVPDQGTVRISGREVRIASPADSIRNGIGMVHQATTLVPEFTALENIAIGTGGDPFSPGLRSRRGRIEALSREFGLSFPMETRVAELPIGMKQKIEIVRALYRDASLLVLDEPTTSLVESEFLQLLVSLRALVERGVTIILITHKIREVMLACQTATVLRRGRVQGRLERDEMSQDALVRLMFPEREIDVDESALPTISIPEVPRTPRPVLELKDVTVTDGAGGSGLNSVSLRVFGGEIVGVASVTGNGEKQLAQVVVNPGMAAGGDIFLDGERVNGLSTLALFTRGVSYTPEDRNNEGILNEGNLTENILLGHHAERRFLRPGGFIAWDAVRQAAKDAVREYDIQTPGVGLAVRRLSGGNVQKSIIARAFLGSPRLLVTHNPTSGLDIATVEFIFRRLVQTRNGGAGVLWINEDLDELTIVCDRIVALYEGTVRGIFNRGEYDKRQIGLRMAGGR